jgi:hypothetical protein
MKKNQKWLIYLLITAALVLAIAKILNIISENKKALPQSSLISTENKTSFKINFSGTQPALPENLYAYNFLAQKPDALISTLKQNYSLVPHPSVNTIWNGNTHYLILNEQTNEYEFGLNQASSSPNIIDLEKAISAAKEFVKANFPDLQLEINENQTKFYQGSYQLKEISPKEANLISFSFAYFVQNYPIFIENQEFAPIRLMISSNYRVQKAIFYPLLIKVNEQIDSQAINVEKAVENINQGQASVISAYQDINHLPDISELSGNLDSVEVEYRADSTTGLIYPYYKFSGNLRNKDGETDVQLITPAIKTR